MLVEAILVTVSPFIVTWVTSYTKQLGSIPTLPYRVALVRAGVAVFSLLAAVLSQMIGEGTVTPDMIDTAVFTVLNAVIATFLYWYGKQKEA
jgi:hypothetical protein